MLHTQPVSLLKAKEERRNYNVNICQVQKHPFRGVLRKRHSENMQQIYMRTPMPKCDFNEVAYFIEVTL